MDKQHRISLGKQIMGTQYFLYFGVMGIVLPYFNLYCFHIGFSGFQIGLLSGVRSLLMVLFPILWGAVADRFQARKSIYVGCNFVSAGIWGLFLFMTDFTPMLLITIAYGIFYAPIISFMEAFTMDILGRERRAYGRIRAWGTIAFIGVVTVMGWLMDRYSVDIILGLVLAGSLLQALLSLMVPDTGTVKKARLSPRSGFLSDRRLALFLFCAFLMLLSHGTYYGFFSIHLETLGYDKIFIGGAWALASVAEILVMISSDRLFRRFSLESLLVFSFGMAALRWILLFSVRGPGFILATQLLHAFSYATFHIASILYIDRLTPAAAKTLGQAVNNAVTYGLGMMAGFFLNGYFYETVGPFRLFLLSSLIALGGGLIFQAGRRIGSPAAS